MDRISGLPDEVLCHVLSFLTTKEAASTSILSQRWRNLLAFVPNLSIDDSVFLRPEEGKRDRKEIIQSLMLFVDRVLALQGNSPLKKVSIKLLTKVDSDRVDSWIRKVLERGVSDLTLAIILDSDDYENYKLSPKCFECSTLVRLKIECGSDIAWDVGRVSLPMLKTLILDTAEVVVDKFEALLHALPALEELVLDKVIWGERDVIVSSTSLKSLTINYDDGLRTLSFDTPSLVYFEYYGCPALDCPVVNMKNLLDARIIFSLAEVQLKQVREPHNHMFGDEVVVGCSNAWKLFHGIQNVPYLDLSADTHEVLSLCSSESMPVFNNLKVLSIKSAVDRGWQAMPVLLRNCPHLETLVIEGLVHDVTDECGDACDCISRDDKGLSLTSCPVKVLVIHGFRVTMKEMSMIKHFLDYFPCLKEMVIYVAEDGPTQLENHELSNLVQEMFEYYNKLSSCNVQLLVSDALSEKWMKNKTIS